MLRDGKPFIARGVIFEGFIEPLGELRTCSATSEYCARHIQTRDYYFGRNAFAGKDALTLAKKDWNVNAVRLNLNQAALDPQNPAYSVDYLQEIEKAVRAALARDLVVFLPLFGQGSNPSAPPEIAARNPSSPLDTATTARAAITLARAFGNMSDVIIELYNEPWPPTSRAKGWQLWLNGGILDNPRSKFNGTEFPGVAAIVRRIRANGANNAIVVQGLMTSLEGLPRTVPDPQNKIIYSVHPFFEIGSGSPADLNWDAKFGDLAATQPVVITAWQAQGKDPWCEKSGIGTMARFLDYLKARRIGVIGYAFDVPFTITRDFRKYLDEPTQAGNTCKTWTRAGALLQRHFLGD